MEFLHRAPGLPVHIGVLPGAFNPVTVAHLALAQAALAEVDEVVFVLPRRFPHKEYTGAGMDSRAALLLALAAGSASLCGLLRWGPLCRDSAGVPRRVWGYRAHIDVMRA